MAGSERLSNKDGKPVSPRRNSAVSHWLAELHPETRLRSGTAPLSEFLYQRLVEIEPYKAFLREVQEQGTVTFIIGWFSESNYSADVLTARTLAKCGELGINIELDYYARSQPIV
jgi:hypothetical protein